MTALAAVPDKPDTTALSTQSNELVARAESLVITDATSYAAAAEFGKGVKTLRAEVDRKMNPNIARWNEGHKAAVADKRQITDVLDKAEQITKGKMLEFNRIERDRLAAEQRERDKKARQIEEDRRIAEAIDLDESGDRAGAEDILRAPIEAPATHAPRAAAPKVAGVATVKRWTFTEADVKLDAIIKHIAGVPQDQPLAHPELRNLLCLDTKATRQLITMQKDTFNVPGIHAFEDEGMSLGTK